MKYLQSGLHRDEPIHLLATSEFPPPARISEPAKTLLVVDDDRMVRGLETQILRLQGYTVLEAENAAEALRVAASTVTIHLLITDLVMPEVDGLELTRRFRAVHPTTPVLMVSGSLPVLRARSEPDLERFDFLAKPFQFNELLHKVRKLLDATAPLPIRKPWSAD
ncbi:MAG: response regulator [Verrucomicrobiota bacterium]|jgi:DNA-binding NtrC family response regulator